MSDTANQHTPGPWMVDEDHRPGMAWNRHIQTDYEPPLTLCFMAHSNGHAPERDDANARLIAAAPDLLAALKESQCIECGSQYGGPLAVPSWTCCAMQRAAIAKAEGRK